MRRAPTRHTFHVTRFPVEFVGEPFNTFRAAFEHDLAAVLCHHPKQPIAIHDSKRFELFVKICERVWGAGPWFERAEYQPPIDRQRYNDRSEEHTSELQSRVDLVCRLLLEKKK